MMTLIPDRVGKPGLPIETPNVRTFTPSLRSTIRCFALDTRITYLRPTRNPLSVLLIPHRPGPACTLRRSAAAFTRVYAGQNHRGRYWMVRDEVHDHEARPSALVVLTRRAASTSALRRTS